MPLDPERALQKALITHLRADAGLTALLTHPTAIHDQPPEDVGWPHLLIGRSESRPVPADGAATEHILTLTVRSRFGGTEEAKAVNAALRVALSEPGLSLEGGRIVSLRVTYQDVFRAADWNTTLGVSRVRVVTDED
ncbi:MAG TPA: DUF3168 domain-containing protein [Brevundimonas sp.]|jgi:hypothetical protein|uniref:DUF3168 domain-containing protein n=1 Tax=Brevundimonas sp. TaxID=1871086 RepID=UPI002D1546B5|nr:DUF3168 domain-containing protein [Brevundimonas sp.]HRH19443.1 DUF3168 domain-containing protein [Brevundimonas sp.]